MIGCLVLSGLATLGVLKLWHARHGGGYCGSRWHRRRYGHGYGAAWQGDDEGPRGGGWNDPFAGGDGPDFYGPGLGHHGRRGRFLLRFLSDRLQASPAQERVIQDAVEEFRKEVTGLRGEGKQTRADLANAFRKTSFDEVMLGELFARHDSVMEKARRALVGMGAKIHDSLDDNQRERLATIIERGPGFMSRGFGW
jgi:hypothetical protein